MLHISTALPQLKSNKQSLQLTLEILSPRHVSTKQRALHVRQSISAWMGTKHLDELHYVPDQSRACIGQDQIKKPCHWRHSLTDLSHRDRR